MKHETLQLLFIQDFFKTVINNFCSVILTTVDERIQMF